MSEYRIHGKVTESETGRPLVGFAVDAFDVDPLSADDPLGKTTVGLDGSFELRFPTSAFRGPADVLERGPDVCVRVSDLRGVTVWKTDVRRNASRDEAFDIRVPADRFNRGSMR